MIIHNWADSWKKLSSANNTMSDLLCLAGSQEICYRDFHMVFMFSTVVSQCIVVIAGECVHHLAVSTWFNTFITFQQQSLAVMLQMKNQGQNLNERFVIWMLLTDLSWDLVTLTVFNLDLSFFSALWYQRENKKHGENCWDITSLRPRFESVFMCRYLDKI